MPPSTPGTGNAQEHLTDTLRPPSGEPEAPRSGADSGIAAVRGAAQTLAARGETHAQAALSACGRAEANLGALLRSVQHLAASVTSAQQARGDVVHEVESLRKLLAAADEEQVTLRHRIAILEQTLDRTEREAARERAFLLDEQDTFIAGLWDDHAHESQELKRRLASLEQTLRESQEENRALSSSSDSAGLRVQELTRKLQRAESEISRLGSAGETVREALVHAQAGRDQAQVAAAENARECERLRTEVARLSGLLLSSPARVSEPPPSSPSSSLGTPIPLVTRSDSNRAAAAARREEELEIPRSPSQLGTPIARIVTTSVRSMPAGAQVSASSAPPHSSSSRVQAAHPEELRAAMTEARGSGGSVAITSAPPSSSSLSSSGIKHKPDPSTRPLIGYSLSGNDLPDDGLESALPTSSRPPGR
jgi:predicted  nucleic acid-binding Zn-ribbon protein